MSSQLRWSDRPSAVPFLTVIVPVYNEEDSLPALYEELSEVLRGMNRTSEVIFIDDGSTDGSFPILKGFAKDDHRVRVVRFRKNFGQTAALAAGIRHSRGDVLVPMDADMQNDPHDIAKLLAKIDEGFDVVSGWRRHRQDTFLTRRLPSQVANWMISTITGVRLHDYGCTLKAYRRDVIEHVSLYGEMHRFVPAAAAWVGASITEMEVAHRARRFGRSKYGLFRVGKVLLDLVTVKFLQSFSTKPIYIFGGGGMIFLLAGFVSGTVLVYMKVAEGVYIITNPLIHLTALLISIAFQMLLMGLLAELVIRTYYESQGKTTYVIRDVTN